MLSLTSKYGWKVYISYFILCLALGRIMMRTSVTTELIVYLIAISLFGLGTCIAVSSRKVLLQQSWWKILAVILLLYSICEGFLGDVPRLPILNETIRNLHYHVPMWFGMIWILGVSLAYSIIYLNKFDAEADLIAAETANIALWFGMFGMVTGMVWAKYTWGEWWSNDPKQMSAAVALLMYFAYFILRGSIEDEDKRAKVAAVYNIIIFFVYLALIFVVPRLVDSLHPGNGGNPALSQLDLDSNLRMVFYPSVIGWILLGLWLTSLRVRFKKVEQAYFNF